MYIFLHPFYGIINFRWIPMKAYGIVLFFFFYLQKGLTQDSQSSNGGIPSQDYAQVFDLTFTRGVSIATGGEESSFAPVNSLNSGTYALGLSILLPPLQKSFKFRIQPQIAWTVFNFSQEEGKLFPTSFSDTISFETEKQRITFIDLPVGIVFLAKRDNEGNPVFFLEAGGFAGYRISSAFKTKFTNSDNQEVKNRISNISNLRDFRTGIYGKVGYKWISLYYSTRLTDVFKQEVFDNINFPKLPEMEIGITIHL